MTQKNATHIVIHNSLTNCDIVLIFQVFKEDLLHERLKPSVCQNGLVNSRKTFGVETYLETKPSVQYKDAFAESSNVAIILTNV